MVSKKELLERTECLDERICDLRYDLNLALKRITELERARIKSENKQTAKKSEPKKKVGRPRKEVKRVDFAKKK